MTGNQPDPDQTISITSALADAKQRLIGLTDTPGQDAQVLLAHFCKVNKSWLFAHPDSFLTKNQYLDFNDAIEQLSDGKPLPYVIGEWEFFGLSFKVNTEVLIPRPETELLVETALDWLNRHPGKIRVAEAGTGSGCIAISLAVSNPKLEITATEISPKALEVAVSNAKRHKTTNRIEFKENDLFADVTGKFDMICANLPYIPTETMGKLAVFKHEPRLALDGGEDGLDLIRRLLDQAVSLLAEHSLILLEIEDRQGAQAGDLARDKFPEATIEVKPDLAGRPRLLVIEK